jgi:hypothetical protein
MEMEQPLLQVVGASLSELFRGYAHNVEKELANVSAAVQQLATQDKLSPDDARQQMGALVGRLKGLKRKVRTTSPLASTILYKSNLQLPPPRHKAGGE